MKIGTITYEEKALDKSISVSNKEKELNQLLLIMYYIYNNTVHLKGCKILRIYL